MRGGVEDIEYMATAASIFPHVADLYSSRTVNFSILVASIQSTPILAECVAND